MPDRTKRLLPKPVRIVRTHARLFGAALIGGILVALLPQDWRFVTRLLTGWDVAVAIYLVLSIAMIAGSNAAQVNRRSEEDDEGAVALLLLVIIAAIASIAAILIELGGSKDIRQQSAWWSFGLAGMTILLSWTLIHAIFAFHYARVYYSTPGPLGAGLEFPADDRPDYWDFVYFSFVIGMTFQVSDVQVTSKVLRRFVVAHGFVSFFFNVAILALTVNLSANLI